DSSIKSPGYDCFLNIERFKYSTNVADGLESLSIKDLYEDKDLKGALRRRYKKLYSFSHPGWGVLIEILWRRVPPEQRKILDALPGWENDTRISGPGQGR
ncbi:11393_t:CDS:2, partial [Dentiscutata heterogama]